MEGRANERRVMLWVMLLSSLIGISIWYVRGLAAVPTSEWAARTVVTFSYFTNISNAFIIIMAAALLVGRGRVADFFESASVQSACCLYIAFVGIGFWGLLGGPGQMDTIWDWIPQMTAHTLSPILGAVYFVRLVPKGQITRRDTFLWLIYPILYLVWWLFRGPVVGYYPYFFIDVDLLGYGGVAIWSGALIVVFLLLGSLMLFVDRRLAAKEEGGTAVLAAE